MQDRWDDRAVAGLDGLPLLAAVSRLLGSERELVLAGGGNTSWKTVETDPFGRRVQRLHVKPSGADLATILPDDFTAMRLDELEPLGEGEGMDDARAAGMVLRAMADPRQGRPSIETVLHALLPDRWVLHSHADAVLALGNRRDGAERVREALGDDAAVIPYRRPGLALARECAAARRAHPAISGLVLLRHGLVTFGESAEQAWRRHVDLVARCERAMPMPQLAPPPPRDPARARELAPVLRGALGAPHVLLFDDGDEVRSFLADPEALAAWGRGPATADHMIRTRRRPCVVGDPADVAAWREEERRFAARGDREGLAPIDAPPRVLLVPGVGMWAAGPTLDDARVVLDIALQTIRMIRRAGPARWEPIGEEDQFKAEYWPLQRRKVDAAARAGELRGRVAWISGAAGGIGRAIAARFAEEGACLLLTDVDGEALGEVARAIGPGAVDFACDVSDPAQVEASFDRCVERFGGLDVVVSNAGIARPAPIESLELAEWEESFAVNSTAHFLVARAALRILRRQGTGGSIVFNASKNVLAPGKGFAAYSASKAAESQLAKVLALEGADIGVRVNLLHPDAVFRGTRLWSDELREQRARAHGIAVEGIEDYYARRNLLKVAVLPEHVAEAALFFASDRSSRTTGACLTIDGGLPTAFPR